MWGDSGPLFSFAVGESDADGSAEYDELITSLVRQIERPGPVADCLTRKAIADYAAKHGAVGEYLMDQFRATARRRAQVNRCQPPSIEEMLGLHVAVADPEYDSGVHTGTGLRGTWARLWSAMVLAFSSGDKDGVVPVHRFEFEGRLGRPFTEAEWSTLEEVARRHAVDLRALD